MPKTITVDTREGHLGVDISNSDVCAGVKIDKVNQRDLLAAAGLRAGMVITQIDGQAVGEHEVAMEMMNGAKSAEKKISLTVLSSDEAVEQAKLERADAKKVLLWTLLVLVALGVHAVARTRDKRRGADASPATIRRVAQARARMSRPSRAT
jgi:predicted metalloprotease with PDZ domain